MPNSSTCLATNQLTEDSASAASCKHVEANGVSEVPDGLRNSSATVDDDDELFDGLMIRTLDFSKARSDYNSSAISPQNPGENLLMRPLRRGDYEKGYVELLEQLATVGTVTKELFRVRFDSMKKCPKTYYTIVLEDQMLHRVVGAVTLVLEQKFIHTAALRGRIEDVVVHRDRRGQDLGKLMVDTATVLSHKLGCYKVSLECKDSLVAFYRQFGYQVDLGNNYMIQRFRE